MRLIYERGGEKIAFPIDDGETYIGRKEDCDIYFPDGSLSKRHARLVRHGAGLVLHDAGSRNGTLHNGKLVQGPIHLRNGDVIQCGKLEFRVEGLSGGDAEFDMVDEESERGERRGSRAAVMRGSAVGSATSTPVAKAVKSGEVRPSVLDEFPEVPGDAPADGAAAPPRAPTARLRLVEGGPERIFELTGETVTIGSKPENAIVLGGDGISRYHAEVAREGAVWVLKDLGARNGLFVAGKKIDLHELKEGDEVQIGTNKLRFEVVKPSAMAGVAEIVAALKADPVGTFKKDQRVRTGAAATVAALVLLLLAIPGGGTGGGGGALDLQWAEEGTKLLVSGDYKGARDIFRKAQAKVPSDQQELPRALTELSTQWCEYPTAANKKDPLQFRWQKAEERLLTCIKLQSMPKSTVNWIGTQLITVQANREAYDKLVEAEGLLASANGLAEQKKYREALPAYDRAVEAFHAVTLLPSAFGARAAESEKTIREQIFALVVTDVKGRMSAAQPEWTGIIKFLTDAQDCAENSQQADVLRAFRSECEQNRQCEVWYQRAVDVVNGRDVNNYQTALRLLEAVTKGGPQIRISPDAQAYYQWIQADLDVRQAQRHYENGDERRAFMLLDKAMQFEVLGPEARNSVKTRKTSWKRVVTAFNEGMRLYEQGTADMDVRRRAQEEFERVLQLEPNTQNRYHVRARNLLQGIKEGQRMTLEARLESGLNAVQNREWSGAFEFFSQVMADPNHKPAHEQQMRNSVIEVAKKGQLVKQAKNDFTNGREERYLNIYAAMKLLRQWLPANHKDREDCEKLYQDTLSFLKRQQRLAKPR